jgi:large subunit ribosomal protein L23
MALFGSKTKKAAPKSEKPEAKVAAVAVTTPVLGRDLSGVLRRPRITEKSSSASEKNVYVFEVSVDSTKRTIAAAIQAFYKVTPIKIAVARIPQKQVMIRGRKGVRGGGKKAYVYLAKGQTIEFA